MDDNVSVKESFLPFPVIEVGVASTSLNIFIIGRDMKMSKLHSYVLYTEYNTETSCID